jgi:hypothetical protein
MRQLFYSAMICCAAIAVAGKANAATVGTVTLSGKVLQACNIVVTAAAGATNIADISAGDIDRVIATVNESCNDTNGYTVTVQGSHSGNHTGLFLDSVSGDSHPFTINYNGNAVASGGVVTDVAAAGINLNKAVKISYGADPSLTPSAGFTYGETLTFTIAAK